MDVYVRLPNFTWIGLGENGEAHSSSGNYSARVYLQVVTDFSAGVPAVELLIFPRDRFNLRYIENSLPNLVT